jgi:hypothetical protein
MGNAVIGEPFTTIEDAITIARELLSRLTRLSAYKYPMAVRRGLRKGVREEMKEQDQKQEAKESMSVRAGARTYFFDLLETTKDRKPYIVITESRFMGEGKDYERQRLTLWPEHAEEFGQAVTEMIAKLGDSSPTEGD